MAIASLTNAFTDADAAKAIDDKNRAFEAAYNTGDARLLVETYFASDKVGAVASPPGGQAPVGGREALIALFEGMIADAPAIRLQSEHVMVSGDLAHELGRAHLTLVDGTAATGRFTVGWVREDGDWRARIDFFAEDGWAD